MLETAIWPWQSLLPLQLVLPLPSCFQPFVCIEVDLAPQPIHPKIRRACCTFIARLGYAGNGLPTCKTGTGVCKTGFLEARRADFACSSSAARCSTLLLPWASCVLGRNVLKQAFDDSPQSCRSFHASGAGLLLAPASLHTEVYVHSPHIGMTVFQLLESFQSCSCKHVLGWPFSPCQQLLEEAQERFCSFFSGVCSFMLTQEVIASAVVVAFSKLASFHTSHSHGFLEPHMAITCIWTRRKPMKKPI